MEKNHHIMFCYTWRANNEKGNGSNIFQNETRELTMNDIDEAVDFIKCFVEKTMNHNKESVQIIFTNIIHLNHCSMDEFYDSK